MKLPSQVFVLSCQFVLGLLVHGYLSIQFEVLHSTGWLWLISTESLKILNLISLHLELIAQPLDFLGQQCQFILVFGNFSIDIIKVLELFIQLLVLRFELFDCHFIGRILPVDIDLVFLVDRILQFSDLLLVKLRFFGLFFQVLVQSLHFTVDRLQSDLEFISALLGVLCQSSFVFEDPSLHFRFVFLGYGSLFLCASSLKLFVFVFEIVVA